MSLITELARKQAGISDMSKGYPRDPRQRGCSYWQRFVASVGVLTDKDSGDLLKLSKENAELSRQLAEKEQELSRIKFRYAGSNVREVAQQIPELAPANRTRLIEAASGNGV